MEAMMEDLTLQSFGNPLVAEELHALGGNPGMILMPPFDGGYLRRNFDPKPDGVFGSADRQLLGRGEIVAQLWNQRPANAFGRIESGLRKDFKAKATGKHWVVVRVDPGPVTSVHGAAIYARSFIPGLGGDSKPVTSHRTTYLGYSVDLQKDHWYRLFVTGVVNIFTQVGRPPSYGEVIASFPRTTIFPDAVGLQADSFEAELQRALDAHDSPQEAAAALCCGWDEGVIELT